MTFKLSPISDGDNPLLWNILQELIGEADIPIEPDATYSEYSQVDELGDGSLKGRGYPSATWILTITGTQKYILRQICSGVSAPVYIETQTNDYDINGERQFTQASAIMKWHEGEQDIDNDVTKNILIRFTHLVSI
jgi:hypothetical protein